MSANYQSVIEQMTGYGLILNDHHLIINRRLQRIAVEGDTGTKKSGWYALHPITTDSGVELIIGAFGNWRVSDKVIKITLDQKAHNITKEEMAVLKETAARAKKVADAKRKAEKAQAAVRAAKAWDKGLLVDQNHLPQYLVTKGILPHGLKKTPTRTQETQETPTRTLMLPFHDVHGNIKGLQLIYSDPKIIKTKGRNKDYWPKGFGRQGAFYQIGMPDDKVIITEGFATGASLNEATGLPVAVAGDAGNLVTVAQVIRKHYRHIKILICGDDDFLTQEPIINPGHTYATKAAAAGDGQYILPIFKDRGDEKLTDFNDLHQREGLQAVSVQIRDAIERFGWNKGKQAADTPETGERVGFVKAMVPIHEAVKRFTQVFGGVGTFFDAQERELLKKQDVLDVLPDHAWRDLKAHPDRQVVKKRYVGFDPTEKDPDVVCNLWGGWPTTPEKGDCSKLLGLLEYLCSTEKKEFYEWVIKWLAYPIQNPGARMNTCLVFQGPQGAGKNLFFDAYQKIYGIYGYTVGQRALEDKHNTWAEKKLFIVADEVVAQSDAYTVKNELKPLITGEKLRINPKMVCDHQETNHVNVVFLSNESMPVVLEEDDRRHGVCRTPWKKPRQGYYDDVGEEIEKGGVAALHYYLLNVNLRDFHRYTPPPETAAKDDLIYLSMGSADRFIQDWIKGDTPYPVIPAISLSVYKAYLAWCRVNGVRIPRESNHFLSKFANVKGWRGSHRQWIKNAKDEKVQRRLVIPDDPYMEPPDRIQIGEKKEDYFTRMVFRFETCLKSDNGGYANVPQI